MSDEMTGSWPIELRGVTETIVTTLGPNDRWNVGALGVHAGDPATAKTFGRTRTWRNFRERGRGYVQFVPDPVDFVEAALDTREESDPHLDSAAAWVHVTVEAIEKVTDHGTTVVTWELDPREGEIVRETVPTIDRGHAAVVEATVAASRLGIEGYDDAVLGERLHYFEGVVERCGGPRERTALDRLRTCVEAWPDEPE